MRRVPAMHSPLTPPGKGRRGRASHASAGEETKEQAKARLQEIESIRDHLRQARKADRFHAGEASRALVPASVSAKPNASSLQRPPVSMPTTLRRHLVPSRSSIDIGCIGPRLSMGCQGGSEGGIHPCEAGTAMFMSRSFALHLTEAPASRHTRADVLSWGHAAPCLPRWSSPPTRWCGKESVAVRTPVLWGIRTRRPRIQLQNVSAGGPCQRCTIEQVQQSP